MNWRKSSYSGQPDGNCIEVGDSKNCTGPTLRFSADVWKAFADQVKGERPLADLRPIL
jgi:hypothetical protein